MDASCSVDILKQIAFMMARIAETLDLFQPVRSHKYVATKAEGKATSVFVW